jgi:hypothetical protein
MGSPHADRVDPLATNPGGMFGLYLSRAKLCSRTLNIGPSTIERAAAESEVDDIFLRLLDAATAQGRTVGPNTARNYAPATFERMPAGQGNLFEARPRP